MASLMTVDPMSLRGATGISSIYSTRLQPSSAPGCVLCKVVGMCLGRDLGRLPALGAELGRDLVEARRVHAKVEVPEAAARAHLHARRPRRPATEGEFDVVNVALAERLKLDIEILGLGRNDFETATVHGTAVRPGVARRVGFHGGLELRHGVHALGRLPRVEQVVRVTTHVPATVSSGGEAVGRLAAGLHRALEYVAVRVDHAILEADV
mmetsp:Transcript_17704/g.47651  ORF Transcript_17704/g.47651 Transcript_17704/m.47651 type:complete len:210 (+) Transcript_17704:262-891(+)